MRVLLAMCAAAGLAVAPAATPSSGHQIPDSTAPAIRQLTARTRPAGRGVDGPAQRPRPSPEQPGGAIGPDGWLYLLGHDRPEMYVVARPPMGPTLIHVATIALEAEGQAFSWAQDGSRTVFTIDRRTGLVRTIVLPPVVPADAAAGLRFR